MKQTILSIIGVMITLSLSAQDLRTSRNTSYYTYVYKLTAKQAERIYENSTDKVDNTYFTQLLDSFPTGKNYEKSLSTGHYLFTKTIDNRLELEVTSKNNVDIDVLNNNRDLSIMVHDFSGHILSDATLKIKNRKIGFDALTNTYLVKRTNLNGLLKVLYKGHTSYFNLKADHQYSKLKIATSKVLYRTPVKYIAIPAIIVLRFPYDTYRAIRYQRLYGLYYYIKKPFADIYYSISYGEPRGFIAGIANIFGRKQHDYKGYMVFNKPKYLPGDTVYFKAYIMDEKNIPVRDSLFVELFVNSPKNMGWIKPSRPGVYTFQFVASGSLGLKLDQNYRVSLKRGYTHYMSGSFKFEEYELKSTHYEFRADKSDCHYKDKVVFYCKGTDENDLQLPDARVELILLKENITEFYDNRVFVPDTLWVHKQNLDPLGETKIIAPDSIFPAAAVKISVEAHFLNSNNELQTKNLIVVKDNIKKEISYNLNNDSVCIDFMVNGFSESCNGRLSIPGFLQNKEITLPYREKINPFAYSYNVTVDSTSGKFVLGQEESNVQCYSRRDKDSVWVTIDNPRNVPVTYTIFQKNRPIFRGTEKNPVFSCKSSTSGNYSASVQYIWGAESETKEYNIPFREKQLNVNIYQPSVVFPGQKVKINVAVTDAYGKPVPNADITALSCTKKFNTNHIPTLTYCGKQYPSRSLFNNFRINEDFNQLEGTKKLDWKRWNPLMSLDTIERYKFLYPKDGLYQFTFSRTDTAFAEVSPFLVDSMGNLLPVNILYIDNDPVYLSVTTNPKPYVFRVDNGWHSLTIRTTAKEIVFHKIFLKKGTKTILSINPFIVNSQFSVKNTTPWYTFNEQNLIRNSVIAVRRNYWNSFAVLNQGANYELLTGGNNYGNYVVGPYKPTYFKFQKFGVYAVSNYFEPGFEYEFQPDLVKMRCWGILNGYKNYTEHKTPAQAFNDSVYTYEDIQVLWQKEVNKELSVKPGYNNPNYTARGNCVLQVNYQPKENFYDLQPKNLLVFSNSDPDFIRIYPGTEKVIHNLIPGTYRIETLLFGNSIIITDSVEVKPNGTNYCRYNESNAKTRNAYTDSISSIIQRRLFYNEVNVKYAENYREEQEKIKELAKRSRTITYNGGHILRGKISDATTSEPLPGVNIIIDGTTTGTVSNIDGEFELSVPSGSYAVSVSFIGYVTERFEFNQGANINVQLLPDVMKLEEIVVVGYGTQKKSDITGSIVNMSSALQGKVAGVSAGAVPDIRIRGISSIEGNSNMLIVIDGIPQEGSFNLLNNEDIANMQVLKDASAVSIYGSRAANGVIVVSTKRKSTLSLLPNILQNKAFMEGVSQSKTLRNRFSDYAFWKPDLTTNNNGIASFEVTFPDDITSWKTYYLAMGMKGASGQAESEIKSFKPIMSSLAVPRFLLAGDRSNILGKALNYTQDSIQVKSTFRMNDSTIYQKDGKILASRIDTFTLSPTTADSVKIQYQILKNDGYSDGELRYIPVFPLGTTETNGNFYNLESDTTITIPFDKSLGTVTLHAEADIINVMLEEMSHLRNYSHLCNEQLSSKLKAMLWERRIFSFMHKEYKYDRDIRKMVKLLEERRNADSLWSWWQKGQTAWWITLHATEALQMAQKDSFKTSVNFKPAMPHLYKQYNSMNYRDQMRVVKLMKAIDTVPDYKQLIDSIKISRYDTVGRYELWELRQSCGLKFPLDSLKHEQKSTQFGNLYWGTESYSLFDDAVSATIVAYRILRNENPKSRELSKIRNYLLERKGNMHWQNTWETCRILETILPDLIKNHELDLKPTLHFSGAYENKIDSFPFHKELKPGGPIYVTKKSNAPVYFTAYQQFFNPAPEPVNKDFQVTSNFENHDTILKAGKPVKLIVNVSVKKASEYVMIEIPIPAGCSYQDKSNFVWGEDYREYFKEKVCIYCSRLAQKNYTFEVNLLPRYNGVYHLNPAKAELMYFPVFFGREGMKIIQIR